MGDVLVLLLSPGDSKIGYEIAGEASVHMCSILIWLKRLILYSILGIGCAICLQIWKV